MKSMENVFINPLNKETKEMTLKELEKISEKIIEDCENNSIIFRDKILSLGNKVLGVNTREEFLETLSMISKLAVISGHNNSGFQDDTVYLGATVVDILISDFPMFFKNLKRNKFNFKNILNILNIIIEVGNKNIDIPNSLKNENMIGKILDSDNLRKINEKVLSFFRNYIECKNQCTKEDSFIILNKKETGWFPKILKERLEDQHLEGVKASKFMLKILENFENEFLKIFKEDESMTLISPFQNLTPFNKINEVRSHLKISLKGKEFRDDDFFFSSLNSIDANYDVIYDNFDFLVSVESNTEGRNFKIYFFKYGKNVLPMLSIDANSIDNEFKYHYEALKDVVIATEILDVISKEPENVDFDYMVPNNARVKIDSINKRERVYKTPHFTYVKGFFRRSKYGKLHFVRSFKKFYGNDKCGKDTMDIKTILVFK